MKIRGTEMARTYAADTLMLLYGIDIETARLIKTLQVVDQPQAIADTLIRAGLAAIVNEPKDIKKPKTKEVDNGN